MGCGALRRPCGESGGAARKTSLARKKKKRSALSLSRLALQTFILLRPSLPLHHHPTYRAHPTPLGAAAFRFHPSNQHRAGSTPLLALFPSARQNKSFFFFATQFQMRSLFAPLLLALAAVPAALGSIHAYDAEYFYSVGDAYIFRGGREGLYASTKEVRVRTESARERRRR